MAKKHWLAGMAIGAVAALGVREAVTRLRNRNRKSEQFGAPELEPEDSRSETYVPNAGRERSRRLSGSSGEWTRAAQNASTPRESRDGEWARQAARNAEPNPGSARENDETRWNSSPAPQPNASTGRTVTPTESELRRTPVSSTGPVGEPGTPPSEGTVDYTHPKAQPAQGGEAPFIRDEKS